MSGVLDILLSMLQINVALGILYIGLEVARYRKRLTAQLEEIKQTEVDILVLDADGKLSETRLKAYRNLLGRDSDFGTAHYYLCTWIGELPVRQDVDSGEPEAELFSQVERVPEPPRLYRWYRGDLDRWTTFVVTSLIPIGLTWGLVMYTDDILKFHSWVYVFLIAGQSLVAAHVIAGWLMVRHYTKKFSVAVKLLRDAIDKPEVESIEFSH